MQKILFLALTVPLTAVGQQSVATPARIDDIMVYAGSNHYPVELAEKGVQGRVVLLTEIQTDGTFAPGSLAEPSGSPELDAAAPHILTGLKGKPQAAPKALLVPVLFYKDSIRTLPTKTCAEFNSDYAYFRATFPGKPASEMNVFDMALGIAFATGGVSASAIRKVKTAPEEAVVGCATRPSSAFMKEFVGALRP